MNGRWRAGFALVLCSASLCRPAGAAAQAVEQRTAPDHPMHYFVSRPRGWIAGRQWPVVVVIPDAFREFERTAREFAGARGDRPFVVVVPMVLSSGGTAQQHAADFDYSPEAWALAGRVGNCRFDDDGLAAVLEDVRLRDGGDARVYLTGWEAGGHVVIAQLLAHPERLRGVAVVTPNYIGRCVPPEPPRVAATLAGLPARVLHGALDPAWVSGSPLYGQWFTLDTVARALGFTNLRDSLIPGQGHGSLAADVLRYFAALEAP
jgi:dienelactone hydrolase